MQLTTLMIIIVGIITFLLPPTAPGMETVDSADQI